MLNDYYIMKLRGAKALDGRPQLTCALRVDIYMPEATDTTDFYLQVVCLDYNSISILDYNSIFISNTPPQSHLRKVEIVFEVF
jgi:hypothetical protein